MTVGLAEVNFSPIIAANSEQSTVAPQTQRQINASPLVSDPPYITSNRIKEVIAEKVSIEVNKFVHPCL